MANSRRTPAQPAREFGCSAQTISKWMDLSAIDRGKPLPVKEGLATAESDELNRLCQENWQLKVEARDPLQSRGLGRQQGRQDVLDVVDLVNANQAVFPLHMMCRVLGGSASRFYVWLTRAVTAAGARGRPTSAAARSGRCCMAALYRSAADPKVEATWCAAPLLSCAGR